MATILVKCPNCKKTEVVRHGYDVKGNEQFLCRNSFCQTKTFQLEYIYQAKYNGITNTIIDMAINGSGIRDTARVMKISPMTVIDRLK
jgi:transposase-like protein